MQYSKNSFSKHCLSHPHCNSDILGRDLREPVGRSFRHIGLVGTNWSSNNVTDSVEVLNDQEVVHIWEKENFANYPGDNFWGEKYGLNQLPELTYEQSQKIIDLCEKQRDYKPEYTLTAKYIPGEVCDSQALTEAGSWVKTKIECHAKFRCDTFVDYCYTKITGMLPNGPLVTPAQTYNGFLNIRTTQLETNEADAPNHHLSTDQKNLLFSC